MKVSGPTDSPRPERSSSSRTVPAAKGPQTPAASVSLSELAGRLQSVESELAAGAPYDAGKVEEIKQAIREGRFKVNAEKVADRLIESMKELLARKP